MPNQAKVRDGDVKCDEGQVSPTLNSPGNLKLVQAM